MKFALLTVSYSGLFYAGKALSVEQQIHKARELGFDALAIETKRPVASPIDLCKPDRVRLKAVAADQGIALCAVESLSNFAGRLMEDRENNLAMMRARPRPRQRPGCGPCESVCRVAGARSTTKKRLPCMRRTSVAITIGAFPRISANGIARWTVFVKSPIGRLTWVLHSCCRPRR